MEQMRKFISGGYGLFNTYWIVTIPLFVFIGILGGLIGLTPREPSTIGWVVIYLITIVVTTVALWNASSKFEGGKIWSLLVKIQCAFTVLPFIFAMMFGIGFELKNIFPKSNNLLIFDFYERTTNGCESAFEKIPKLTLQVIVKEESKEVFGVLENHKNKEKTMYKLDDSCLFIDAKNWECGGKTITPGYVSQKYQMNNGDFKFTSSKEVGVSKCEYKVIKQ